MSDRQDRPRPTGNPVQDFANRRIFDHIYDIRNNYSPTSVFANGNPNATPVTVPAADSPAPPSGLGFTLTLSRPGQWLITAAVALTITGDNGSIFTLTLAQGSTPLTSHNGQWSQAGDGQVMMHQTWQINGTANENIRLLIQKDTGGGTSAVNPQNSTLSALWQGAGQ